MSVSRARNLLNRMYILELILIMCKRLESLFLFPMTMRNLATATTYYHRLGGIGITSTLPNRNPRSVEQYSRE